VGISTQGSNCADKSKSIFFNNLVIKIPSIASTTTHITEAELIKSLRRKDQSALDYLYDHYSGALYGVIVRILKQDDIAEEVLQDVFFRVWERIDQYDPARGKLFTWMINIARNQAIDKTRSAEYNKSKKTSTIETVVSKIDNSDFTEQRIEGIGVPEILRPLPDEQRFVIERLYFDGYTQSELAKEFNIPLGTVKTRLRLAMQFLRNSLQKI
jgi:RNA polymerase sigma-70 factor (ECF subfamily)